MSAQGYYSLIQYSEFPERNEFVNIGVVLFSDVAPRVLVRFSDNPRRVEKAFGVSLGAHFRLVKESAEKRIYNDFLGNWNREEIDRFINLRSGKIRLSPPKSIFVGRPQKVIEGLFDKLVGELESRKREPRISTKLRSKLKSIGVESLLEKPNPVPLPQGVVIKAPYAYQNGAYNLLKAVSLRDSPDHALEVAGKHAIEGRWLFDATRLTEPKQLVIIGDVSGQQENFATAVSDVMRDHRVKFYSMENLDPLVADIRLNFSLHH